VRREVPLPSGSASWWELRCSWVCPLKLGWFNPRSFSRLRPNPTTYSWSDQYQSHSGFDSFTVSTNSIFNTSSMYLFARILNMIASVCWHDRVVYRSNSGIMGWTLRSATYLRLMYKILRTDLPLLSWDIQLKPTSTVGLGWDPSEFPHDVGGTFHMTCATRRGNRLDDGQGSMPVGYW
jgi:hypothetical protein